VIVGAVAAEVTVSVTMLLITLPALSLILTCT
jgi:hypothetical protein